MDPRTAEEFQELLKQIPGSRLTQIIESWRKDESSHRQIALSPEDAEWLNQNCAFVGYRLVPGETAGSPMVQQILNEEPSTRNERLAVFHFLQFLDLCRKVNSGTDRGRKRKRKPTISRCAHCHLLIVDLATSSGPKEFCSNACRQRAHRGLDRELSPRVTKSLVATYEQPSAVLISAAGTTLRWLWADRSVFGISAAQFNDGLGECAALSSAKFANSPPDTINIPDKSQKPPGTLPWRVEAATLTPVVQASIVYGAAFAVRHVGHGDATDMADKVANNCVRAHFREGWYGVSPTNLAMDLEHVKTCLKSGDTVAAAFKKIGVGH